MKIAAILMILLIQAGGQTRVQTGTIRGAIRGVEGSQAAGVRVSAVPVPSADGNAADVMIVLSQTDASGQYVLEGIPPGRYVVAAGLVDAPNYYPGVSSIESARVLNIAAGTTTEGIDFTLARSPGVRVSGRLKGYPSGAPGGLIRVAIIGSRDQESTVAADGTFEFQRVAPGVYGLRLTPSINLTSPISRIEVQDKDIESIVLEAGAMFPGKLVVDDGSPLPALAAIPDSPARVRLWAQSLNTQARAGSVITPVRASDGTFLAMLSEEEYRIGVVQLPLGYFVQSISLGSLDLLQSSLKVTKELSDRPAEIRVTLTRTPPRGAPVQRTVSGRVFGVPAGLHAEYTVMAENGVNVSQSLAMPGVVVRTGEASVRADGTFEIPNVPPGNYSLRVFHPGMGMPGETVGIAVNDTDVREVELVAPQLRSPSSAAIPPPPPLNPLQPAVLPPAQPAGVRVSGVVTLAGINERTLMPHSVVLFGSKFSARTLQIPVSPDGAFELLNVPPGEYDLRPLPLTLPAVSTRFIVDTQEVKDLRITLPPQSDLRGSLQTTEGKVLPGLKGAILKLESPSGEITLPVGENGGFTARLAHGEYKYSSTGTTEGYAVIPGVLRVSAAGVQEVRIDLRANP